MVGGSGRPKPGLIRAVDYPEASAGSDPGQRSHWIPAVQVRAAALSSLFTGVSETLWSGRHGDVTSLVLLVLLVLLTETVVVSPAHGRPLGPREAGEPSNAPGPTPSPPLRGSSLSPWRWLEGRRVGAACWESGMYLTTEVK